MIGAVKKRKYLGHLKSNLRENSVPRTMLNFREANTVGLLFNATHRNEYIQVEQFAASLKKRKKSVKILAFIDSKSPSENIHYPYFSRNDCNWFDIPSSDQVNEFIYIKFDILINLCSTDSLPLEYISAVSSSKFRIGRYDREKTYCYDFMINNERNASLDEFILEVDHFLENINVNG